jgi:predicted GNAT superfamily acetyltransferase
VSRSDETSPVAIHTLTDPSDLDVAARLFDAVWPAEHTQVQVNLLRALVHAGGYAAAASLDGEVVGAALGFVGRHQDDAGRWHVHLHSHMAAVLPQARDRHVGSALKWHQREWCLAHEIDTIVWTFDPLVRRNAYMNLIRLGVDVSAFEVDFYGPMGDAINAADATDRLFAWWRLRSERTEAAKAGRLRPMDLGAGIREIPIPEDIVQLRSVDPVEAARWRGRMRADLQDAFDGGWRIVGLTTAGGYALEEGR